MSEELFSQSPLKFIPAEGKAISGLMCVGEGPGLSEWVEGRPFIGQAGKYFRDKMIKFLNVSESDIYITNCVKVRPPGNRTPTREELLSWKPLLNKEILEQKPRIILTLGACASQTVLNTEEKISKLRGRDYKINWKDYSFFVVPTWHPSYLIRQPNNEEIRNQLKFDLTIVKNLLKNV